MYGKKLQVKNKFVYKTAIEMKFSTTSLCNLYNREANVLQCEKQNEREKRVFMGRCRLAQKGEKMGSRAGRRSLAVVLAVSLLCQNFGMAGGETVKAADGRIEIGADQVTARHYANGHGPEKIVDGDTGTDWQSVPSNGEGDDRKRMYDHNRYIDIALDGTYSLSQIRIFNRLDDSYNNYYVYASADGSNYNKIIAKTSNDAASAEGDSYTLENVEASYLRLNMAYNSNAFATNLAEIEVYGTKISDTAAEPEEIFVEGWQGSAWQEEWDRVEEDEDYAKQKTLKEMSSLVGRVLGNQWKKSFRFEMRRSMEEGKDVFEIRDGADSTIVIRGNNGVAMASGFNYYLKNYADVDYNPLWDSNTDLKEIKPVGGKVVKEAQFDIRYALNFCTYSYTMAFWNWDEYEEFLDWAAMNGLNLILDIVGQEEVLRQTLKEFGYTDEEVKDYICGPAYFAWFYMQNLYSVGGPLPDTWFEQRAELGRKIHDRMQTYGISPVIQAFAGQVPETFPEKNEGAVLAPVDYWPGFTRPAIIKTYLTDEDIENGSHDYFEDVAKVFYEKQKNVFGNVSHYYAADPFHENGNSGNLDVATLYQEVQNKMIDSDKDAIWVMQQWQGNLNATRMSKLQVEKTLPLDLQADMNPQHGLFEQNGAPWIYCMLHNFGGRMGLDGEIPVIALDPAETFRTASHMKGIGMTPEAMENSPVVYELLFDTNWSKDPVDYETWLKKYSSRRAGGESKSLQKAWRILLDTAYADKGIYYQGAAETVINARPADTFNSASTWGHSNILYDKEELDRALLLLKENYAAFCSSPAYKYDLADVAEQVLCNAASSYHALMVEAKNEGDLDKFTRLSSAFLGLVDLSDQILSTTDEFMLGTWIEASRKMIVDADDWTKDLFEFNARSLVTTWAGERPNGGGLKDYSNRKWAGLTKDFYRERWAIWIRNRIADLKGEERNAADAKAESNWFLWEYQWVNRKSDDGGGRYAYATEPSDADLSKLAEQAYESYSYTNLEKNTGGMEQEVVNLAKNKPVSVGSSNTGSGTPGDITDGDTATGWIAEGAGPHTAEIDLGSACKVRETIISVQQGAGEFPYNWKLEYRDPDTLEWVVLKEEATGKMVSNTSVAKECRADKIRVTISTSNPSNFPVNITEITVNGEDPQKDGYENLAGDMAVAATVGDGSAAGGSLSNLTDQNTGNVWSAQNWQDGGANFPVTVTMTLPQSAYADTVEVYFESAGRPFTFYATVTDEAGQEEKISPASCENQEVTEKSYRFDVKKNISQVKICITGNTGKGSFPGSWPALSEIKVMGTAPEIKTPDIDFTGKNVSGITVSGGNATEKTVDGSKESFDRVSTNEDIVFDLHGTYYLSHVNFTFEKGELGLKYKVLAEDASGGRIELRDASQSMELLGNRTVRVLVGQEVTKIIFIHMGNNGQGTAAAAETRLYEFEACGVKKVEGANITVTPAAAIGLTDKSAEYTTDTAKPIVLSLENEEDINMIRVFRGVNETKTLKYKAEYYDENETSWKVFADLGQNQDTGSESSVVLEQGIFAKQIRLAFTESMALLGIDIYTMDHAGAAYPDRTGLLVKMADAKELLEKQEKYGLSDKREELLQAYTAAREVYETYDLAQAQLEEAENALAGKISEVEALLGNAIEQKETEQAKKELSQFLESLKEQDKKEYTKDSWKEYEEALKAANEAIANANAGSEAVAAAKFWLEQALSNLKKDNSKRIEQIVLTASKTELNVGETLQIQAKVLPEDADDKTLKWTSDHAAAAVSENGMVSAKAEGMATITAEAQDGSDVAGTIMIKIVKKNSETPADKKLPAVGKVYKTSALEYKVTASSETSKKVIVQKSLKKKTKKIVIPAAVKIDGYDYKVTEIKAKVFRNHAKATQAVIGANVEKIGKEAFFGCKKLKKVVVSSKVIKSIGKKAFANIDKKAKITVPKAKKKAYKKLFQKAKTAKSVKVK